MFLRSFASQLRDVLLNRANIKYQVLDFIDTEQKVIVKCKFLETGEYLKFYLIDIITKNKLQFFSSKDILVLSHRFNNSENSLNDNIHYKQNKFYYPIIILFILCLLTSNLAATKICNFGLGIVVPGGTIIFPLLYILNDILTEVYGFTASRKAIWTALFCNLVFSMFLYSIVFVPYPEYWLGQEAFSTVFSLSPRIFIASLSSYLFGEMTNATILSLLKLRFKGKFFAARAIISTIFGALLESTLFCFTAFLNRLDIQEILSMVLVLTVIKVFYEILLIPVTTRLVTFLKFTESQDVFERPSFKGLFTF